MDNFDEWLDNALKEIEAEEAHKRLRRQHPYVLDLIEVLRPYPRGLARQNVLQALENRRHSDGLPIPPKFEAAVQSTYNRHCVDSSVFIKRKAPISEGLFYSPGGKGSGIWAAHLGRAMAWLNANLENQGH